MDREKLFAATLKDLLLLCRRQNNRVTREQITDAFRVLSFNEAQLLEIENYLAERKISVYEDTLPEKPEEEEAGHASRTEAASLRDYRNVLARRRNLSDEEKESLFRLVKEGDGAAKSRLIECYLPMVDDISRLYEGQGVFAEDLVGEGNVALVAATGLLGAVETVAEAEQAISSMIMNAMEELIDRTEKERADDEKTLNRVREVAEKTASLKAEYRRNVTVDELLEETGWTPDRIHAILRLTGGEMEGLDTAGAEPHTGE